jgi:hypothetical protein
MVALLIFIVNILIHFQIVLKAALDLAHRCSIEDLT